MEELQIGAVDYQTRLTRKFKNRVHWEPPRENHVLAVIPGTIQDLMVKVGDEVTQGQALLVLEAMKMRNLVLSPMDGTIERIHVEVGEQVPKAHLMIELR